MGSFGVVVLSDNISTSSKTGYHLEIKLVYLIVDTEISIVNSFLFPSGKMSGNDFDYIVVGTGINGTWSAYHLAKRGYKTLIIEQATNTS